MAGREIEIVARTIRDWSAWRKYNPMLPVLRPFTGDLGDRVPLIGAFKRPVSKSVSSVIGCTANLGRCN
jgi:hypothetical protein